MNKGITESVVEELHTRQRRWPCASTPHNADSFRADLHPGLKADFVPIRKDLANPPFNMSDWGGENLWQNVRCFSLSASLGEWAGVRCRNHSLPVNNANYAWIQHFIHRLSPVGVAGFVLANGSMSTQTTGAGDIGRIRSREMLSFAQ